MHRAVALVVLPLVQHPEVLDVPMSDELVQLFVQRGWSAGMLANTMTGKAWADYTRRRAETPLPTSATSADWSWS